MSPSACLAYPSSAVLCKFQPITHVGLTNTLDSTTLKIQLETQFSSLNQIELDESSTVTVINDWESTRPSVWNKIGVVLEF